LVAVAKSPSCQLVEVEGKTLNLARIILVVAALAVAGVTAFLVRSYLQGKEAEIAENGKKMIPIKALRSKF